MKQTIIYILGLLLLASCSTEWDPYANKKFQTFSNQDFKTTINLKARKPDLFIDSLIRPGRLVIIGDYLLIAESKGSHPIHSFNLKTKAYKGLNTFGEGPGEIMMPWWLSKVNDNSVLVFDAAQRKVLNFDIDTLLTKGKPVFEKKIKEQRFITTPLMVGDEIYYLFNDFGKKRLYSINIKTGEENSYGDLLTKKTSSTTDLVQVQANQAYMNYSNQKIYIAYKFTPFIEVFDCKLKIWEAMKGPESFNPIYAEQNMNKVPRLAHIPGKTLYAYLDIATTENFIYLLYQGENVSAETKEKLLYNAHNIYVFDKQGAFVKHYKLDKGIRFLTVYKDTVIYGINYEFVPELVEYKLK